MEQEIPEVFDGTVEIMNVSREAGDRTKVAVRSHNPNVDAIGTIVGRGGSNIKRVISKFHPKRYDAKAGVEVPVEENIDVIQWVEDPAEFIYNAIAPAEVDIGRRGQNVRLAAHLTGYRIDIKSASEYEALEAELEAQTELVEEVVEDSVASAMVDEAIEEAVTSAIVDETVEVEDTTKSDLLSDDDTE